MALKRYAASQRLGRGISSYLCAGRESARAREGRGGGSKLQSSTPERARPPTRGRARARQARVRARVSTVHVRVHVVPAGERGGLSFIPDGRDARLASYT